MKKETMRQSSAPKKTRVFPLSLLTLMIVAVSVHSCSGRIHVVPDEDQGVPVTIRVASLEQQPFGPLGTKGSATLSDACSVISFCIYTADGHELYKPQVNQKSSDESFGTLNIKIEEGSYRLVVLAHSSSNPKMSDLSKIEFQSNSQDRRIADTFMYSADITVQKGMQPLDLDLDRVVGKFEIRLTNDPVPATVSRIEFEISGGGSFYLNSNTGFAPSSSSSSRYTDKINVQPGDTVIEFYTFVCEGATKINKVTVNAKDADGGEFKKVILDNVPIARNRITRYRGIFFGEAPINTQASISLNTDWVGTDEYSLND